jgi:virginiamycin A acetyltransferase
MKFTVSQDLLLALHRHTVLLKHNAPEPVRGSYGWLAPRTPLDLKRPDMLALESFTGPYGGAYKGLPGSRKYGGFCSMGAFSYAYSALPEPMRIGRYCSISSGLRILDSTHPVHTVTTSAITFRPRNKLFDRFVTPGLAAYAQAFDVQGTKPFPVLEHDVWIGANVTLAMGVRVGTGAIVASGSLVTTDVAPYTIVAGNPAQPQKTRFAPELAARLLASRWWELDPGFVFRNEFADPDTLCLRIERERSGIAAFEPPRFDFRPYMPADADEAEPQNADTEAEEASA